MRSTTTLSRRAAAVALAGALAFGVSACSDDDGDDVDVVDDAATEIDDAATEVEDGVDDAATEMTEEMTEAETEG